MEKVKKCIIVAAAALFICCPVALQAQSHNSEFTVSLGAGSSALKYQLNEGKSKSGFGWELGAGYSYYFSKMLGVSLGLELANFSSSVKIDVITMPDQQIETPQGLSGNFLLRTQYKGFEENQSAVMLQIPVMLQFQYPVSKSSFLFLGAGIKAGFPVSSKWNQSIASFKTTGYSEYTGQLYDDMPTHGFSTHSNLSASGKLELKSPVLFAIEGGLKFSISKNNCLYTGLFLDYGLNDIYKTSGGNTPLLEYNNASPANYNYNSILMTSNSSGGIKPFAVGIKIKMGFGI